MPISRALLGAAAATALLFASSAAVGPALAQTGSSPTATSETPIDPETSVLAKVGDTEITLADLLRLQQNLPPQYRQVPIEVLFDPLLDQAINTLLIRDAARGSEIATRPDVQERMQEAADQALAEVYLTETISAQVTDEALRARYEETVANQNTGEEAKARHILLENEEDARSVIEDLDAGADFAAVAQERSTGPSAAQGGDLGWFKAEQMVPEFSTATFALEPGTYTKDPVQSQFGWHVILLEDKRSADAPPFEQLQEQLAAEMTRELIEGHFAELRQGVEIERFPNPLAPPPN